SDFKLNEEFFSDLCSWEFDTSGYFRGRPLHRRRASFLNLVEKVRIAVERLEDFTGILPRTLPSGACGLIDALAVFLNVGPAGSNNNTYLFAGKVAKWVSDIRRRGCATPLTKYTYDIIILIGEVIMALSRWVAQNYRNDCHDINTLVDKVVKVLQDDALWVTTSGPSAMIQKLRKATRQRQLEELTALIYEIKARHTLATKREREQEQRLRLLERQLDPYTIAAATYHKQNKLPCDKGIRLRHLDNIKGWIKDVSSAHNVLLLSGEPNCGKSAIMVSIARYCQECEILGAMLFINRKISNTTNPDNYFPTIAVQMLRHIFSTYGGSDRSEAIQDRLHDALGRDTKLLTSRVTRQAPALFVDIIKEASKIDRSTPFVILVDGFDETDSKRLEETVGLFSGIFKDIAECPNAKIIICSGNGATPSLTSGNIERIYLRVEEPYEDALDYISHQLESMFSEYKLDPLKYPGNERLSKMAHQASHDIRKAFTLLREVRRNLEDYGTLRLDMLLDLLDDDIATAKFKFSQKESQKRRQIASSLYKIFDVPQEYRRLLGPGAQERAQVILDGCQELLDSSDTYHISTQEEGSITTAMYRLAEKTGRYPRRLVFDPTLLDLSQSKAVSSGAFGDIHKVPISGGVLCLKTSRPNAELIGRLTKMFTIEGIIWSRLSHPNVLPFNGILLVQSTISLVSPWAENGNIRDFLNRPHPVSPNRVLLCADTAAGIKYLHEKGMVHGDIKTVNMLVDRSGRACVADFGLSNVNDSRIAYWTSQSSIASKGGTPRYQAPELHRVEHEDVDISVSNGRTVHNTKQSDVYAWGGLCYEILTGNAPFYEYASELTVVLRIMEGRTPSRPVESSEAWQSYGLTPRLWGLMERCWEQEAANRPTMANLVSQLDHLRIEDTRPAPQWPPGTRFPRTQAKPSHNHVRSLDALCDILLDFEVEEPVIRPVSGMESLADYIATHL
ncbi:hypothetical protein DXG01_014648, partial [Tephrocybe rancida]